MQRYVGPVIVGGALGALLTYFTEWMNTPDNVVKFRKREPDLYSSLESLYCADDVAGALLTVRLYAKPSLAATTDAALAAQAHMQQCWLHLLEYLHATTVTWMQRNDPDVDIDELSLRITPFRTAAVSNLTSIYQMSPQKTEELMGACQYIELLLQQLEHDVVHMRHVGDEDPLGRRSGRSSSTPSMSPFDPLVQFGEAVTTTSAVQQLQSWEDPLSPGRLER